MVQLSNDRSGSGRVARRAESRRTEILRAAARVFRRSGLAAAGMREIAAEADLSPGNLYHYFQGKDEILFFCQEQALERLLAVLEVLEEDEVVKEIDGNWYWASSEYPSATVNLRNISGPVYTIQDGAAGQNVIGTLDEISAMSQLHSHAVYLHGADTYFVNQLDLEQKIAFVERKELDYYTQSVQSSEIRIDETEVEEAWRDGMLAFGDVTVTTSIPMFKKIRFHSRDSLGFEKLELPPQILETVAFWFAPPPDIVEEMTGNGMLIGEALMGIANVLVEVAPLFVMCDTQDIGVLAEMARL